VKQLDAGNEAMLFIDADRNGKRTTSIGFVRHDLGEPGHRRKSEVRATIPPKVPVMTRECFRRRRPASLQAVFSSNQKQSFYDFSVDA